MNRRRFIAGAGAIPVLGTVASTRSIVPTTSAAGIPGVKLSCNLYSFNDVLRSGEMSLEEVLEFCADLGLGAVDPTGYYFPGYPALPDDSYVYRIKRRAFRLGLDISGTGVRNDFTLPDPSLRQAEIEHVKRWVGLAARFGAPVLRVFSGEGVPDGYEEEEVTEWVADALRESAAYGARHGVIIVLQNHADFIRTADQLLDLIRSVDSEWLAVNLDIGSFRIHDPYEEVAKVAPYAATWQIKENVFVGDREVKTDLGRIMRIVGDSGYRGYLPIETLGPGDPRVKVPRFLEEVRSALEASA